MSDDHFKPPRVPVGDRAQPATQAPIAVRNACAMVLISLALGYLTLIPGVGLPWPETSAEQAFTIVILFGVTWLTYWLTTLVRRRSNRGRWGLFAFLALTWLLALDGIGKEFELAPVATCLSVFCIGLEIAAMALLFTGSGARWFER